MQIAFVGLGRMGGNMVTRLLRGGHEVVGYDPARKLRAQQVGKGGAKALVQSIEALVAALTAPRAVWVMVPAGEATESTINDLAARMAPGDTIIDGGNSKWTDDVRRAEALKPRGIDFIDAGTSGGIWGLENGYCLMVGGDVAAVERCKPAFLTLAPPDGFLHVGASGAGHFTKMIHNGIEYGMMQSYAEGFEILEKSEFKPDLQKITHLWNQGSVVRSWLLELAEEAFKKDAHLDGIKGYVQDSGEGRWTIQAAIDEDVPAPVLTLSLQMRFRSRQEESFAAKVNAALRNEFGGHAVKKA